MKSFVLLKVTIVPYNTVLTSVLYFKILLILQVFQIERHQVFKLITLIGFI